MSPLLLLGSFFVLVMGVVLLAGYYLSTRQTEPGLESVPRGRLLSDTLLRVGEAAPPPAKLARFQNQLNLAGYRFENAAQIFSGAKIAAALGLGLFCAAIKLVMAPDPSGALLALIAAGGLGYLIPDRYLEFAVKRRARRLLFAIPSTVDLIVLALEAGQSLDAALMETAREITVSYPEMAAELNQVQMEMLASRSRPEVYRLLRDRNSEPEIKRLAQVFIDSDRFGTGLAPALRNHVRYLRIRLRQQAQEQARKISVKLIFPVFFLIFPAVILITLGPAVIQIYAQLGPLTK